MSDRSLVENMEVKNEQLTSIPSVIVDGIDPVINVEDDNIEEEKIKEPEIPLTIPKNDQIILERICKNVTDLKNIQKSFGGQLQYSAFYGINLGLENIEALKAYRYLQKVDISNNGISDLSPLINLEHLIILNASNNAISQLSGAHLPNTLKHADFSRNSITEICDFQCHPKLTTLYLDSNQITTIEGLIECERLHSLSLAYNYISRIENLEFLPLQYLNLSHNILTQIENLDTLSNLREVNLSSNSISSLNGLQGHHVLEVINVNDNEIESIEEILHITCLQLLRSFTILENPIEIFPNFGKIILFRIQRLLELNGSPVSIHDKVEAINMFSPSLEVITNHNHMTHSLHAFLVSNKILYTTMSSTNEQYPILALVGPEGSGKGLLAMRLAEDFPEHLGYGIIETTRIIYPGEVHNRDFNFNTVDNFMENVANGEYVVTSKYLGDYFGLKRATLENLAENRKACITHMRLESMVCLQNTVPMPQFILTLHTSETAQYEYMKALGIYSETEIANALASREVLIEYNQNHPGAFCYVIPTDSLEIAHKKLQDFIRQWISSSENIYDEKQMTQKEREAIRTGNSLFMAKQRGYVEEESVRRRQLDAQQIVKAMIPSIYDQIERSSKIEEETEKARRVSNRISGIDLEEETQRARGISKREIMTSSEEEESAQNDPITAIEEKETMKEPSLSRKETEETVEDQKDFSIGISKNLSNLKIGSKLLESYSINNYETVTPLRKSSERIESSFETNQMSRSKHKLYNDKLTNFQLQLSHSLYHYDNRYDNFSDTFIRQVSKARTYTESNKISRLGSSKLAVVPPIEPEQSLV